MCIHIYIYIYMYVCIYIYIYICIERERERKEGRRPPATESQGVPHWPRKTGKRERVTRKA